MLKWLKWLWHKEDFARELYPSIKWPDQFRKERKGVFELKDKPIYVKILSDTCQEPVRIPVTPYFDNKPEKKEGDAYKRALKLAINDAFRCANVYRQLMEDKLFPPDMSFAVSKNYTSYITLIATMPEMTHQAGKLSPDYIKGRIEEIVSKYELDKDRIDLSDLIHAFNWGLHKDGKIYALDLDIHTRKKGGNRPGYKNILMIADRMELE